MGFLKNACFQFAAKLREQVFGELRLELIEDLF